MMFSTILVGLAAASMTSAWQILNYDNGGCSGNGRIFAGSGETDCLGIEGDVWGIRFNPQVCSSESSSVRSKDDIVARMRI
jgi:hypothetical protein